MPETAEHEWREFLNLSQIPNQKVYLLGCFAKHVTLYSQQVRALNLIAALRATGRLVKGSNIAIIGAGASGLMAAAAAFYLGANVTLLEELRGPLELQRNNRQRWIHPFIYDWPFTERHGQDAKLPLLNWRAGYAADVAEQICGQWRRINDGPKLHADCGTIDSHWGVSDVSVISTNEDLSVSWTTENSQNPDELFNLVIMAVGFGLEAETDHQYSYWSEDRIDGDFRRTDDPPHWFVSGTGDGALTDIMRLCLRRFRHHEIEEMFRFVDGIDKLKDALRAIHPPDRDVDPALVDKEFKKIVGVGLASKYPHPFSQLKDVFLESDRLRNLPPIKVACRSRLLYGPDSSLLNRLIVSQLEHLGKISIIRRETTNISRVAGRYQIEFKDHKAVLADHVIQRHGPQASFNSSLFPDLWNASMPLKARWAQMGINRDPTRRRLWQPGDFGSEAVGSLPLLHHTGMGVEADGLHISKVIRDDGSSISTYEFRGLSVTSGALSGLHFSVKTTAGSVGFPQLTAESEELGMHWEEDDVLDKPLPLNGTKEWVKNLSTTLYFKKPLVPGDRPIDFSFTIPIVNGDALTNWEYEQMYSPKQRAHVNGDPLTNTEFLARIVWFPVRELRLRITIPPRVESIPIPRVLKCFNQPHQHDVVKNNILHIGPSAECAFHPKFGGWPRSEDMQNQAARYLVLESPQTWVLNVPNPDIATCYSLDWELPIRTPDAASIKLIEEATAFRSRLLNHGEERRNGRSGDPAILEAFKVWAEQMAQRYGTSGSDEDLEVSLMTYDEKKKELIMCEAFSHGEDAMTRLGNFRLPFGLGLAGTCFKEADDKVFAYERSEHGIGTRANIYLPLDGSPVHEVLLAVPLDHPNLMRVKQDAESAKSLELSRQYLGVVNIGSNVRESRLKRQRQDFTELQQMRSLCQEFATKVMFQPSQEV